MAFKRENMKVKELKEFLSSLPKEADDFDVAFGATDIEGIYEVSEVFQTCFEGEIPEGMTKDFVMIWNGELK